MFLAVIVVLEIAHLPGQSVTVARAQAQEGVPTFERDTSWPKPLPNNWIIGQVCSLAVDARDHVWILHRPKTVPASEITANKKVAPPVIEVDANGNFVQAWGGPGPGYSWPEESLADYPRGSPGEHGIYVDYRDNVWVTGNGDVVLKFTRAGKFLMQIGEFFKKRGQ